MRDGRHAQRTVSYLLQISHRMSRASPQPLQRRPLRLLGILNENSINIGLVLSNDLTNCNVIWVNKDVLFRESKSLDLEVIIVLRYS